MNTTRKPTLTALKQANPVFFAQDHGSIKSWILDIDRVGRSNRLYYIEQVIVEDHNGHETRMTMVWRIELNLTLTYLFELSTLADFYTIMGGH